MDFAEAAHLVGAVGQADLALVRSTRDVPLLELAREWSVDPLAGLRGSTLTSYLISLRVLARFGIHTAGDATPLAVRAFLRRRVGAGLSPETANRNLAALGSLLNWLHQERRVLLAQVLELRELYLARPARLAPAFLRPVEYVDFRGAVRRAVDERFELLAAFGVEAGLRYHEAVQLWGEDLELCAAEPFLRVALSHDRRNKKNRERTVPLRRAFANELLARDLAEGPLFPARERRGHALKSPYLHRGTFKTRRLSTFEGVGFAWDWHVLRHTFASWNIQAKGREILPRLSFWMDTSVPVLLKHYAALIPGGDLAIEDAFAEVAALEARRKESA